MKHKYTVQSNWEPIHYEVGGIKLVTFREAKVEEKRPKVVIPTPLHCVLTDCDLGKMCMEKGTKKGACKFDGRMPKLNVRIKKVTTGKGNLRRS